MQDTKTVQYDVHDIVHFCSYKPKIKGMYEAVGPIVYKIPAYEEATPREVTTFYSLAENEKGFRGMLRALPCDRIIVLTQYGTFIVIPVSPTLHGMLTLVSKAAKKEGIVNAKPAKKLFEVN